MGAKKKATEEAINAYFKRSIDHELYHGRLLAAMRLLLGELEREAIRGLPSADVFSIPYRPAGRTWADASKTRKAWQKSLKIMKDRLDRFVSEQEQSMTTDQRGG